MYVCLFVHLFVCHFVVGLRLCGDDDDDDDGGVKIKAHIHMPTNVFHFEQAISVGLMS